MTDWLGTFLAISARREIGERLLQAEPAWVWSRDGSALAWANPAGARLLGLHTLEDLAAFSLSEKQNLRRDIVNVARTLGQGATLARLRFYQGARSLPLACHCERLRIGDGRTLILVTGSDVIGGGTPPDADELVAFLDGAKSLAGIGSATFVLDCDGRILARRGNAGAAPDFRGLAKPGDEARSAEIDGWSVRYVTVNGSGEPRILLWADRLPEIETAVEPAKAEHHPDEEEAIEDDRGEPDAAEPGADDTDAAEPDTGEPDTGEPDAGEPDAEALEGELQEQNLSEQARILRSAFRKPPGAEAEESAAAGWPHALDNLPKKPVRFLWQTDADDRFLFVSPGLEQLVGRASDIVGERWNEIARRMRLDPVGRITEALAARDTWSGFTAWWPDTEHRARIPAELTALPVFALDQSFQGYRGFGVLKPAEALSEEAFDRRFPGNPAALPQTPPAAGIPRAPARVETRPEPSGNVVPIRHDIDRLPDFARLSPQERSAFEEIATALRTPHEAGRVETGDAIGEIVPSRASRAEPPVEADDAQTEADEAKEAPEYSTDADDPAFLASLPDDDDGDYPPDVDEAYPEEFADLLDSEDGGEAESGDAQDEDLPDSGELAAPEPANDDELAESGPAAEDEEDDEGSGSDEQRELAAGDLAEDGDDHEDAGAGIDGA
ncbi:MAG TPA: hypothetical protein VKN63_08335, partial [Afifellaceae bacterium]|nr:hypothetical protein [Afifellaceae bacterium]